MPQAVAGWVISTFALGAVGSAITYGVVYGAVIIGGYKMQQRAAARAARAGKQGLQARDINIRSGSEPATVVYGHTWTGGVLSYADQFEPVSGSSFELIIDIVHASHECDGITAIQLDNTILEIGESGPISNATGRTVSGPWHVTASGPDRWALSIEWHLGAPGQTASPMMLSRFPITRPASATYTGLTHVVYNFHLFQASQEVWRNGQPLNLRARLRGKKVYDPRLDSTNGGDGPHRLDDPTTFTYSSNPILCAVDYALSYTDIKADEIGWSVVAANADICDETSHHGAARYSCNGVLSLGESHESNFKDILSSCCGRYFKAAGIWYFVAGAYQAPTVTLGLADIVGDVVVETSNDREDLFNTVSGTYYPTSDDTFGQRTDFNTQHDVDLLNNRDLGVQYTKHIELPFTSENFTAQRVAWKELQTSRARTTFRVPLRWTGLRLRPWDRVQITYPRFNWSNKIFRVLRVKIGGDDAPVSAVLVEDSSHWWADPEPEQYISGSEDYFAPTAPQTPAVTQLMAVPRGGFNRVSWVMPLLSQQIDLVLVYASEDSDWANAELVWQGMGTYYDHYVDDERFYWVRCVANGRLSMRTPDNDTSTISATPLPEPEPGATVGAGYGDVAVFNADFNLGNVGWTRSGSGWSINTGGIAPAWSPPFKAWRSGITPGDEDLINDVRYPVRPGNRLLVAGYVLAESGTFDAIGWGVQWYDEDREPLSQAFTPTTLPGVISGWQRLEHVYTAPAGAAFVSLMGVVRNHSAGIIQIDNGVMVLQGGATVGENVTDSEGRLLTDLDILNDRAMEDALGGLNANPSFRIQRRNIADHLAPASWYLQSGTNPDHAPRYFDDADRDELHKHFAADYTIANTAIPVSPNTRYGIFILARRNTTGTFSVQINEYDSAALPAGKTFVGTGGGELDRGVFRTRMITVAAESIGDDWALITAVYQPTVTARWASLAMNATSALWRCRYAIVTNEATWGAAWGVNISDPHGTLPENNATRGDNNLIVNPGAENGVVAPHAVAWSGGAWSISGSTMRSGSRSFRYLATSQNADAYLFFNGPMNASAGDGRAFESGIKVVGGESYRFYIWYRAASAGTWNRIQLQMRWGDADGDFVASSDSGAVVPSVTTWTRLEVVGTAPAAASCLNPRLRIIHDGNGGDLFFDDAVCYQRRDATQEVNGPADPGATAGSGNFGEVTARNPGFELGAIGWGSPTHASMTFGTGSSAAHQGAGYLVCAYTGPPINAEVRNLVRVPVTPGQRVRVSGWVRTSADAAFTEVRWRAVYFNDAGSSFAALAAIRTTASTGWVRIRATGLVPAGAASMALNPQVTAFSAGEVYWDDGWLELDPGSSVGVDTWGPDGQILGGLDLLNENAMRASLPGMNFNPYMTSWTHPTGLDMRPSGWWSANYDHASAVTYLDQAVRDTLLRNATSNDHLTCGTAMRVNPRTRYEILMLVQRPGSETGNVQLSAQELDTTLPFGKQFIGPSGTTTAYDSDAKEVRTRAILLGDPEAVAPSSSAWSIISRSYLPSPSAAWFTPAFSVAPESGSNRQLRVRWCIVREVSTSSTLDLMRVLHSGVNTQQFSTEASSWPDTKEQVVCTATWTNDTGRVANVIATHSILAVRNFMAGPASDHDGISISTRFVLLRNATPVVNQPVDAFTIQRTISDPEKWRIVAGSEWVQLEPGEAVTAQIFVCQRIIAFDEVHPEIGPQIMYRDVSVLLQLAGN